MSKALAIVQGDANVQPAAKKIFRRQLRSRASTLLPHCSGCGSITHEEPTCPNKDMHSSGPPQHIRCALALERNKRVAKVVPRLKYNNIKVWSAKFDKRPKERARASLARSFKFLMS